MTIMAAQGRNDARFGARLLASVAKDCVNSPENAPGQVVALGNVYRLLEAFRVNSFFGSESPGGYHRDHDTLALIPQLEQHVGEVRIGLERAMAAAFVGKTKNDAILTVEEVLRRIANPALGAPPAQDKANVARFFSELVEQLRIA